MARGVNALFYALNGKMNRNKSKRGTGPTEANWSRIPKVHRCIAICLMLFLYSINVKVANRARQPSFCINKEIKLITHTHTHQTAHMFIKMFL